MVSKFNLNKPRIVALTIIILTTIMLSRTAYAEEPDWTLYNALLQEYVQPGEKNHIRLNVVDYSRLSQDPRLTTLAKRIGSYPTQRLNNRQERLAFYINAYNIWTLQLVAQHWPVDSIKDIGSLFRSVWQQKTAKIDNQAISLDDIEHNIIRSMNEARIHFAVNCASVSCPDLRTEAYTAAMLEQQLDEQTVDFLNNRGKGLIIQSDAVIVSKLFKWYAEDFVGYGGVDKFIANYTDVGPLTDYLAYDWSINGY